MHFSTGRYLSTQQGHHISSPWKIFNSHKRRVCSLVETSSLLYEPATQAIHNKVNIINWRDPEQIFYHQVLGEDMHAQLVTSGCKQATHVHLWYTETTEIRVNLSFLQLLGSLLKCRIIMGWFVQDSTLYCTIFLLIRLNIQAVALTIW